MHIRQLSIHDHLIMQPADDRLKSVAHRCKQDMNRTRGATGSNPATLTETNKHVKMPVNISIDTIQWLNINGYEFV